MSAVGHGNCHISCGDIRLLTALLYRSREDALISVIYKGVYWLVCSLIFKSVGGVCLKLLRFVGGVAIAVPAQLLMSPVFASVVGCGGALVAFLSLRILQPRIKDQVLLAS